MQLLLIKAFIVGSISRVGASIKPNMSYLQSVDVSRYNFVDLWICPPISIHFLRHNGEMKICPFKWTCDIVVSYQKIWFKWSVSRYTAMIHIDECFCLWVSMDIIRIFNSSICIVIIHVCYHFCFSKYARICFKRLYYIIFVI